MQLLVSQADSFNLVTGDHAWVLPSYYDPNWWRIANKSNSTDYKYNCTDEKMQNILESVIFIDGIKLPPVVCNANTIQPKSFHCMDKIWPNPASYLYFAEKGRHRLYILYVIINMGQNKVCVIKKFHPLINLY